MVNPTSIGPRLLREALKRQKCLIGPGVFDGVSTKIALAVGFDFLYLAAAARREIADADTGFGGPLIIRRTVRLYEHAGADVAFIESPWTKDEMRTLVRELAPHPVLINVLPDNLMGNQTTAECKELGFATAIYLCTASSGSC
ncbi:aae5ea7c-f9af-4248-aa86-bf82eb3a0a54 [Thermothielavioides terrestris]|uniref:Aae5ea7c-f9af-4248-aa86-bf82eb3a0a54 n=1 Tax=Thermothielavioides terrestris TaxID=2587410 RepID=A0A446BBV7_9PEZI|nr:aae5ea7c-f9af-4248-aa86-bf82eb3a0a54 [Thermothielavioides terrestris]